MSQFPAAQIHVYVLTKLTEYHEAEPEILKYLSLKMAPALMFHHACCCNQRNPLPLAPVSRTWQSVGTQSPPPRLPCPACPSHAQRTDNGRENRECLQKKLPECLPAATARLKCFGERGSGNSKGSQTAVMVTVTQGLSSRKLSYPTYLPQRSSSSHQRYRAI